VQQIGGATAEASVAEVRLFQFYVQPEIKLLLIEAVLEDLLDRAIGWAAEVLRPRASGFQPQRTEAIATAQDALGGAQMVEHFVSEERLDHR
jgi:hypothetical protein